MPCGATQDGRVMVESSDRMWSTAEGNGKPLQYSGFKNPMNSMKRQKDRTLKEELPRSAGAEHATGDQWRNNSRKNEETKISKTMLNSSGESGQPCLIPDVRGNAFNFSPLRVVFAVGLSYMAFIMLRYIPSIPDFWRVFIINGC